MAAADRRRRGAHRASASPVSPGRPAAPTLRLDGRRLSGRVHGLLDAGGATHLLVYLADGRAALVEAGDAGRHARRCVSSLDRTRPLMDLDLRQSARRRVLGCRQRSARGGATRVLDAGRVMLAADTLGAAQSMLDQAVAYAKERVQFGRVIGSFQGVKHTLRRHGHHAGALPRAGLVRRPRAGRGARGGAPWPRCQAKAHLAEVGREVARLATEVHGGMGFTDLLGLHYWFKRIAFNRQLLGGPERCRHEAAVAQGWVAA